MGVLSTTSKAKLGAKAAKAAIDHPGVIRTGAQAVRPAGKLGFKLGKPWSKRRARQKAETIGDAARALGESLALYVPQAAYGLGLVEPPKPKRTAPRVIVGVVIGAAAVYFLEPEHGAERRHQLAEILG